METYKIPVSSTTNTLRNRISLIFDTSCTLCGIAFVDENNICTYTATGLLVYNKEAEFLKDYAGCTLVVKTFESFSRACKPLFMMPQR